MAFSENVSLKEGAHFTEKSFPCKQCGAALVFCADLEALKCEYCGYVNTIPKPRKPIVEHDLTNAIGRIEKSPKLSPESPIDAKCPKCGGTFRISLRTRSTRCPYCDTPIVTNMDIFMPLAPESLLPFALNQKEAKRAFREWVGSLWLAPSALGKYTDTAAKFEGIYLPSWTYDSHTTSHFRGLRGDTYYERVVRTRYIDGRYMEVEEMEPRIEWTPVSGVSERYFDDLLIGASDTIPRTLIESLKPWDLENLVPFDEKYLSGFESETYTIALDEGLEYAKSYMEYAIREDIRRKIGGDRQQITQLRIYYDHTTFKYILLPVWTATFDYGGKTYRFAINARTGKVEGERPYSGWKIFFLVLFILLLLGAIFALSEMDGETLTEKIDTFVLGVEPYFNF